MEDILLSHAGRQHSYKVALSLQRIGRLDKFVTTGYYKPSRYPDRLLSGIKSIDKALRKRYEPGLEQKVVRLPFLEIPELLSRAIFGNSTLSSHAVCLRDSIFDSIVSKAYIKNCKAFWGFQGSCLESLNRARTKGIKAIAEFATAHVLAALSILGMEKENNPEWADSIGNLNFPGWYTERLKKEPFAADYCIAASTFTRKTLEEAGVEPEKILMLPLGADLTKFQFKEKRKKNNLQILFVGSVGQRKGIKYLIDAVKKINSAQVSLKVIGPIIGSGKAFKANSACYNYLGKLSQEDIVKNMHECDCLILPSLFEGFGLVIPEAMATGTPVIASTSSAGPDIIRPGIDGFLVEPCDTDDLAGKIEWLASNKDKVPEMGRAASQRAKEFSWDAYNIRLGSILERMSI